MNRPRLLDLFCGAGGAAMGYQRAGFHVTGVDIKPQPNYCGDDFAQYDAPAFLASIDAGNFDAIHASPPCQAYSSLGSFNPSVEWPDLYAAIRVQLRDTGLPWVMENVVGAPYETGVVLCGSMFDLGVRRHRNFETSFLVLAPRCEHEKQGRPTGVYGHGQFYWENGQKAWRNVPLGEARAAMGIDWMQRRELSESIPPAYTTWIGEQLLAVLSDRVVAHGPAKDA